MAPKAPAPCQICGLNQSKYTCSSCFIVYCSIPCYKQHKEHSCTKAGPSDEKNASVTSTAKASILEASNTATSEPAPDPCVSAILGYKRKIDDPLRSTHSFLTAAKSSDSPTEGEDQLPLPPSHQPLKRLRDLNWPYVPEESQFADPLKRDDPKTLQLHHYEAIATSPMIRKLLDENPKFTELLTKIDQLRGQERESALQQVLGITSSEPRTTSSGFGRNATSLDHTEEHTKLLRSLTEAVNAIVRGDKSDALGLEWGEIE